MAMENDCITAVEMEISFETMDRELSGIRSEQKLKENVQSMKDTDAGETALRGRSGGSPLPKEWNKITQKGQWTIF